MLASTVQFSRYGRNESRPPPIRAGSGPSRTSKRPLEAAASSGPNSVLTQPGDPCARSAAPVKGSVLAAPSSAS
jgi:hypothetical protein